VRGTGKNGEMGRVGEMRGKEIGEDGEEDLGLC